MKVLVACEESQRVCIAFRERGHEAYSCDIQDCSGGHPEWHIKGDALNGLAYDDDSQVTELEVHKLYGDIGDVYVELEEIKEGNNGK